MAEIVQHPAALASARLQYRQQHALRPRARRRTVAAPDLAIDHRRTQRLLRLPIGRLNTRIAHKGKPLLEVVPQMLRQPLVFRHYTRRIRQRPQTRREGVPLPLQLRRRDLTAAITVALVNRLREQGNDPTGKVDRPSCGRGQQLPRTPQRMSQALLMDRFRESPVGSEAIMAQHTVPVHADHPLQNGGTALRVDAVAGGPVTDPDVEPGRLPSDPPAGFVRRDLLGTRQLRADGLVVGLQPSGGPQADLGAGPAGQGDAKQRREDGDPLAVRQAGLRVQQRSRRLGIGPDLAGGRAHGVGGLQGMPPLHPSATLVAVTDMDAELAHDGPTRDVGLELLGDAGFDQASLAVRAGVRQRRFVAFVDLFGRRFGAMTVATVGVAALASGGLGLGLGWTFAEGCGLSFAGTEGVLEPPGQLGDLSFELSDALKQRSAAGTGRFFHTVRIATRRPIGCACLATEALNNYLFFEYYFKTGKYNLAFKISEHISRWSKNRQNRTNGLVVRFDCHIARKQYIEALNVAESIVRDDPQWPGAFLHRGMAFFAQAKYKEALQDYDKSLKLDHDNLGTMAAKAYLLATCPEGQFRDGSTASKLATKCCEMTQYQVPRQLMLLAMASAECGDYKEAVRWAKKSLEKADPDFPFLEDYRKRLALFEQGKPYRFSPNNRIIDYLFP